MVEAPPGRGPETTDHRTDHTRCVEQSTERPFLRRLDVPVLKNSRLLNDEMMTQLIHSKHIGAVSGTRKSAKRVAGQAVLTYDGQTVPLRAACPTHGRLPRASCCFGCCTASFFANMLIECRLPRFPVAGRICKGRRGN